jgi:predicted RNA-binding protein YlqC (UPF0109 family)/cold shock CspA family protein
MVTGTIKKVMCDRGFGFIRAEDETEIFFHRSALVGVAIEQLNQGQPVELEVENGPKGPRASRVRMAGQGLRVGPGNLREHEHNGEGERLDRNSRFLMTQRGTEAKQLIEQIAKSIVDRPDMVEVTSVEGENFILIELQVDKNEIGKVVGKNGRTITAIRTVLNAHRSQKDKRQVLDILG